MRRPATLRAAAGTRPLLDRRSGDDTTPAGVFPLGESTAWDGQRVNVFGNRPDPGVRTGIGYRDVRPQDCWGASPTTTARLQPSRRRRAEGGPEPTSGCQRYGDVYSHAAVIGANLDPISGDAPGEIPYAAAIFLHRHSYASERCDETDERLRLAPRRTELADDHPAARSQHGNRTSRSGPSTTCARPPDCTGRRRPGRIAWDAVSAQVMAEAERRRTFAIISHPDAGKTTLTEKFLLYAGAIQSGGAVKAHEGRRSATSDWMDMEQKRGISISSTALNFPYREHEFNLLDTPGHRDFSEDTYRVLSAVDAVVMVLDSAKGIEPQTLKLFEVCRSRDLPVLTFLNKLDRPGLEPLELLDQIEEQIGLRPTPATWPVGSYGDLRGVLDRRTDIFTRFTRTAGAVRSLRRRTCRRNVRLRRRARAWEKCAEESELLDAMGADVDLPSFLAGESTPVFAGSALTNFGVRHLLDAIVDLAPAPTARPDIDGKPRHLDEPCSAFVFKVQANMDRNHRDRIAFARICSGKFDRGMVMTCERTGKPFATKYASTVFGAERTTIDEAFPGDVVGLVNATGLNIGDTLYDETGPSVEFPKLPQFAPEVFATARPQDSGKVKQFRKGLDQLGEEGVVQVLARPRLGRGLAGARRCRPAPVRCVREPARHRVQRTDRAVGIAVPGDPTDRRRVGRRCSARSPASAFCSAPMAHSSHCSRTSTRCSASSRTSRNSCSPTSSPDKCSLVPGTDEHFHQLPELPPPPPPPTPPPLKPPPLPELDGAVCD